jgi:hypothetical protein
VNFKGGTALNKLKLDKSNRVVELQAGDVIVDGAGDALLIVNAGTYNSELFYRLIDLETGNRWDDEVKTLDDILQYVKGHGFKAYRDNEFTVNLGSQLL